MVILKYNMIHPLDLLERQIGGPEDEIALQVNQREDTSKLLNKIRRGYFLGNMMMLNGMMKKKTECGGMD
jgi:hypothetical protein